MLLNHPGFFSWQGNKAQTVSWSGYIVLAVGIIGMLLIWIFRDKLRNRVKNRKTGKVFFIFKNEVVLWRLAGGMILSMMAIWISLQFSFGYSFYWEALGLHLCRILFIIIGLLLLFNRRQWLKYVMHISIVGFVFGFIFSYQGSDVIDWNEAHKAAAGISLINATDPTQGLNLNGATNITGQLLTIKDYSWLDTMMVADGVTSYHQGFDSYFAYDKIISHLIILLLPTYYYVSRSEKMSFKELIRALLITVSGATTLWSINALSSFIPDPHWRSNYWFIGLDQYNNMGSALGWLSSWPQNLFTYAALGLSVITVFFFLYTIMDKLVFFKNGKFVQKVKSENWARLKKEKAEGRIFKNALNIKKK